MDLAVTQEMFDKTVLENIEEFEMTTEEAIKETVEQFKVQVSTFIFICVVYSFFCYIPLFIGTFPPSLLRSVITFLLTLIQHCILLSVLCMFSVSTVLFLPVK